MPNIIIRYRAKDLYQNGITENLRFSQDRKGLVLADQLVIEDDAPGAVNPGCDEKVSGPVRVKKELVLDAPEAARAWVLVYRSVDLGDTAQPDIVPVTVTVNGTPITAELAAFWNYIGVTPGTLVKGANQVEVACPENSSVLIPIVSRGSIIENEAERFDIPQRSFKSKNNGDDWSSRLGPEDGVQGEYRIRLHLARFVKNGSFMSPVIDLTDVREREKVKSPVAIDTFTAMIDKEVPPGTEMLYYYRSGTSPVFTAETWKDWVHVRPEDECSLEGRYFQGKILFKTSDPLASPVIRKIELRSSYKKTREAEAERINIGEFHDFRVLRSGVPFRYEMQGHRFLRRLREQYGLDQVAAGAKNQFETIIRLNHWAAGQKKCLVHAGDPAWNALDILGREESEGTPAYCCSPFAVVLAQCCLAFGIQARLLAGNISRLIPGHLMVEVWSDNYGKWILMDPALDRYYLDKKTVIPLNALEVQQQVLIFSGKGAKRKGSMPKGEKLDDKLAQQYLEQAGIVCREGDNCNTQLKNLLPGQVQWGSLRVIPRNNFFSEKYPIPRMAANLNECSWNGWFHWRDEKLPGELQFDRFVDKTSDFYWTLNQVALYLQVSGDKGVLSACMDTHTPELATFLVSVDDTDWLESGPHFSWHLKEGPNQLKVKVRNQGGVEGTESRVNLNYSSI